MIEEQITKVYYSPAAGRRYLTKRAAINNEAKAIIYNKYPREEFEPDTGHSYDIRFDSPEAFDVMLRRLTYKINKGFLATKTD